jgi:hypothetical protein
VTPLREHIDAVLVAGDISQNELARRCGWHVSRFSRLANAKSPWRLADAKTFIRVVAPLVLEEPANYAVDLYAAIRATPLDRTPGEEVPEEDGGEPQPPVVPGEPTWGTGLVSTVVAFVGTDADAAEEHETMLRLIFGRR